MTFILGVVFIYEAKTHRPLSIPQFRRRLLLHFSLASAVVMCSLLFGMAGYSYFENLAWREAFLNAAMLLGGMGPVNAPQTDWGKLFAGIYALYSGLMFIVVAGVVLAPLIHRLLHKLHWVSESE